MNDFIKYDILHWYITELENKPIMTSNYYPLMETILKDNGFLENDFFNDRDHLAFLDRALMEVCPSLDTPTFYFYTIRAARILKSLHDIKPDIDISYKELIDILKSHEKLGLPLFTGIK